MPQAGAETWDLPSGSGHKLSELEASPPGTPQELGGQGPQQLSLHKEAPRVPRSSNLQAFISSGHCTWENTLLTSFCAL